MSTFAITGCGRSGTMWLSRIMNRSQAYTVEHEPDGDDSARFAHYRFAMAKKCGRNYGEVNSRIRCVTLDLPLEYRGVIIRHPLKLARSAYNRNRGLRWLEDDLELSLAKLDELIECSDVEMWRFELLTTDLAYLNKLTQKFGVTATVEDQATKRNVNTNDEELPDDMRAEVLGQCGWFVNKYYGGEVWGK